MNESEPRHRARTMSPARKARIRELEEEVRELRERIGAGEQHIEEWEGMPQELRDRFAARALMMEWGSPYASLARLGFGPKALAGLSGDEKRALRDRIFLSPGVQAILRANLEADEARRKKILDRQFEIAEHGDNDQSTRSAQVYARLAGWLKEEPSQTNVTIHLASLVGGVALQNDPSAQKRVRTIEHEDPALTGSIDSILTHDPGAPQRVDDELSEGMAVAAGADE